MSDKRDDDTTPARPGPAGEDGTPTESTTAREPLVSGDPLGLGGTSDPDAPSRRPRPRIVSLLGEFFKMSRTTAGILIAFVLIGALYLLVREEPVVAFGPPPGPTQTEVPTEEVTTPPSSEQVTETSVPTEPTSAAPTGVTTDDPASAPTTTSSPDRLGNRTTQQQPQATQQTQQTPQQQPQPQPQLQPQQVPEGAAAGPTGDGQIAE